MTISSQLPPISLAQASANLRVLAQSAGQTVEARVLAHSSSGTTHVQIGRQVLSLALPEAQPVGAILTLSVQQSNGQLQLALVAVKPPEAAPGQPQGAATSPATTVQISPAALSSGIPQAPVGAAASPGGGAVPNASAAPASVALPRTPPAAAHDGQGVRTGGSHSPAPVVSAVQGSPTAGPLPATFPASGSTTAALVAYNAGAPDAPAGPIVNQTASAAMAPAGSAGPGSFMPPGAAPTVTSPQVAPGSPAAVSGPVSPAPMRPDIPYMVAVPAVTPPGVTAISGPVAKVLPPVAQAVSSGTVGQHAAGHPGGQPPQTAQVQTTSSAQPANPQAALSQMVQHALPRQDSIVGLTRVLTAIAGKVALPEPVAKAAQQVLAARLPLDAAKPPSAAAIKAAVQQSGLFQEAMLASGQSTSGDLKTALLGLRQGLGAWLGNQAPVAQVGVVAPPLRGQVPRARGMDSATPDVPDDPAEIGKVLIERTEAALSRLRLHQNASLPDTTGQKQDAQWSMDLPVVVAGQHQVLQMQIQRDAEQDGESSEERSWQVRFAINLAERGEVGAQISLRAKNTSLLLWADDDATAQALAKSVDELRQELAEVGLVPSAIVVRAGAPAQTPMQPMMGAGHVLDATR